MCRVYRVWLVVEVDDQLMEKGLYLSNLFYLTYHNPSLHGTLYPKDVLRSSILRMSDVFWTSLGYL